jgi:hypothetical protein
MIADRPFCFALALAGLALVSAPAPAQSPHGRWQGTTTGALRRS